MANERLFSLSFFPVDVYAFADDKLRRLMKRKGSAAATLFLAILGRIYRSREGYYVHVDDNFVFALSEDTYLDEETVLATLTEAIAIGLFNKPLYEQGILTSVGIQRRYVEIWARHFRKRVPTLVDFSLLSSTDYDELASGSAELPTKSAKTATKSAELASRSAKTASRSAKAATKSAELPSRSAELPQKKRKEKKEKGIEGKEIEIQENLPPFGREAKDVGGEPPTAQTEAVAVYEELHPTTPAVKPPNKAQRIAERTAAEREQKLRTAAEELRNSVGVVYQNNPQLYSVEMIKAFLEYWNEPNADRTKCRWKCEEFFDTASRLATWARNERKRFQSGGKQAINGEVIDQIVIQGLGRAAYQKAQRNEAETTNL